MLLNEFQRQQRMIEAQAATLEKQAARIAELEQDRQTQTARIDALERQSAEIAALKKQVAEMADARYQVARFSEVMALRRQETGRTGALAPSMISGALP